MPMPKFQIGDRVTPIVNRDNLDHRLGVFTIVRRMPFDRNYGFQYRAESAATKGERVFREEELVGVV